MQHGTIAVSPHAHNARTPPPRRSSHPIRRVPGESGVDQANWVGGDEGKDVIEYAAVELTLAVVGAREGKGRAVWFKLHAAGVKAG